jgi:hypothetical protein
MRLGVDHDECPVRLVIGEGKEVLLANKQVDNEVFFELDNVFRHLFDWFVLGAHF